MRFKMKLRHVYTESALTAEIGYAGGSDDRRKGSVGPVWSRRWGNRSSKPWNRPPGGQAGARSKAVHQGRDRCGGGGVRAARLGGSERRGWSTVADLRVGASLDGKLVALLAATGVPLRG